MLVNRPFHILQADIVDMSKLSGPNYGNKYILMVMDSFTRYAFATALKTKSGLAVAKALQKIFANKEHVPKLLFVDRGGEFYNSHVKSLLKKHGIKIYSTSQKRTKAFQVERLNRTIKEKLYKHMTANNTRRYVDNLQNIIDNYNNTKHNSIKISPEQATNDTAIFHTLYDKSQKRSPSERPIKIGSFVRKAIDKSKFEKGFTQTFSDEYYTIGEVLKTVPYTYTLKNLDGNAIPGSYYAQQLIRLPQEPEKRVDKIVKRKGNQVLVRWKGFDESHDEWLPKALVYKTTTRTG